MDKQTKAFLGKILGEIYRLQRRVDAELCVADDAQVYGLLHGMEYVINQTLEDVGWVSEATQDQFEAVLGEIFDDHDKLERFEGYYDIEPKLTKLGIGRSTAIGLLKYLQADGRFSGLIAKMKSQRSPTECTDFDLDRSER